jgi:hypothetical protein
MCGMWVILKGDWEMLRSGCFSLIIKDKVDRLVYIWGGNVCYIYLLKFACLLFKIKCKYVMA